MTEIFSLSRQKNNTKGVKIAAPDLRKEHQVEFLAVLLSSSNRSFGFRNKDLKQILGENWKTAKIAYSPHKIRSNFWLTKIISRGKLYKLRECGAVKKIQ